MLKPGEIFDSRYLIVKLLGKGGMGDVYLAQDILVGDQEVALKILKQDLSSNQTSVMRFIREVELARRITSKNVVRTYDLGETSDHTIYFTMEYVRGVCLSELLNKGPIQQEQVIMIFHDLLTGLKAIHEAGVIHRDLKPSNIIITHESVVKIADFGIARPINSDLTSTKEIIGSGPYMAPELWQGQEPTKQTDIYALGAIVFEALLGCLPFKSENLAQQMYLHLDGAIPRPRDIYDGIDPWLSQLISFMLNKNPSDRPKSVTEILSLVEKALSYGIKSTKLPIGNSGQNIAYLPSVFDDKLKLCLSSEELKRRATIRSGDLYFNKNALLKAKLAFFAAVLLIIPILTIGFYTQGDTKSKPIHSILEKQESIEEHNKLVAQKSINLVSSPYLNMQYINNKNLKNR